jgi:flavin reductase (DIM6/NTAB) family NADH-FMN oxidoreductase RutF
MKDFEKTVWKPGTMLYPVPAVLISCGQYSGGADTSKSNIITVAWTGTVCSDPAMLSISIRPERHSHAIIKKTGQFAVNLTTKDLAFATDWCGVRSGKDIDKFKKLGLTPLKARSVSCPIIGESPINIECETTEIKKLGSHDMFIAKVLCVHASKRYMGKKGVFDLEKAGLIAYSHGKYHTLGKYLGHFGYSVRKKK